MTVESLKRDTTLAKNALLSVLLIGPFGLGCGTAVCDCPSDVDGLVKTAPAPVTSVDLAGSACSGGQFRCIPEDFDNAIHGECKRVQIEARAEGQCVVTLTVGGMPVQVQREMTRRPDGCCGGFIGEANHAGEIDLGTPGDGGVD
jgi:hypothetical protein